MPWRPTKTNDTPFGPQSDGRNDKTIPDFIRELVGEKITISVHRSNRAHSIQRVRRPSARAQTPMHHRDCAAPHQRLGQAAIREGNHNTRSASNRPHRAWEVPASAAGRCRPSRRKSATQPLSGPHQQGALQVGGALDKISARNPDQRVRRA